MKEDFTYRAVVTARYRDLHTRKPLSRDKSHEKTRTTQAFGAAWRRGWIAGLFILHKQREIGSS